MKVIIVAPYPRGEAPSQRFRFEQYIPFLEANGVRCDMQSFWDLKTWRVMYKRGHTLQKLFGFMRGWLRRVALLMRLHRYDLVFMHREAAPVGPPVFEWLMAKVWHKKIIYDFDDAIWLPNASASNAFVTRLKGYGKVKHICKWSWKISCGNEYLAAYARRYNPDAQVIPTTVDTDYYAPRPKPRGNKIVIGWTGSQSTNAYLTQLEPVFEVLRRNHYFELRVISNQPPALKQPFTFVKWNRDTEVQDLLPLDIGLMPLANDEWSRGKCGFKLIQYMALGTPAVASPVGVNLDICVNKQTGLLAATNSEWITALERVMNDPSLRQQLGANGRKHIEARYSVKSMQPHYLDLFMSAG